MSASNPETHAPETNTTAATESKQKRVAEPIYTYVISWGWLVTGLVCVIGFAGIAGATYYIRFQDLPKRIVDAASSMMAEAERAKEEMNQTEDHEEKGTLMTRSLKLRTDAANLLNKYQQVNPNETGEELLEKLYDIVESLYYDYGGGSTTVGRQRGDQLTDLASKLIRTVDDAGSIRYRTRLLELAWDRIDFRNVIDRGRELFNVSRSLGEPENYDAMRYITMVLYNWLPVQPYDRSAHQLPPAFMETLDELLEKLNSQRPGDVEIAKHYAEFLVNVGREDRANFTASASEALRRKSSTDRLAMARECIDAMVQHNSNDPAAYLARYQFLSQYSPSDSLDSASPDLQKVLELAPSSAEGLILSGLHALRQAEIARMSDDTNRAEWWNNQAETYLRRTIRDNPGDPYGYRYLGEYLLLVKKSPREAIAVWNEGLKNASFRGGSEELIGRLVMVLLQEEMVKEAKEKLSDLLRTIDVMRGNRSTSDVTRTQDMHRLLTARLFLTEANLALAKIENVRQQNRREDVRRLYGTVQQKRRDAVQQFESVLVEFGRLAEHYVIDTRSVYYMLLPQSLLQLGQLKLEMEEWDYAATYFFRASRFRDRDVARRAFIGRSIALQQANQLELAAEVLKEAEERNPDDLAIRHAHAMVLFRSRVASNAVTLESLNEVQEKLESLKSSRSELQQPWILDVRLIHLGVVRANLSNQADTILEARNDAVRKFRALERQTFPPDAEGNARNYIDDPVFVAELVGIYSGLAAREDFDRLLEKLREFPDGEDAYYGARINDALRRDSKNEAVEIIDEAIASPQLSAARRDQFVGIMQNLKGENLDNTSALDKFYNQLKTTFDENPETLKPQAFFVLAEMALDIGETERAKLVRDRLEKIEGKTTGTYWRYVTVRLMLGEEDPDYEEMREIQAVVASIRENWDRSYVLGALIEEHYFALHPDDTAIRDKLITAYRNAIRCGNMQPEVWQRLIGHLESAGLTDDSQVVRRNAALRGVMLESRGQLPQPYGPMYAQVQKAIENEDAIEADMIARQCIKVAEGRGEKSLLHTLHLVLGKAFLDASMYESARRHLSETARRGGRYVYPLALCLVKFGESANDPSMIDAGFSLLLDEIDFVPSVMQTLLPAILVMLTQVQPSETVYERIDNLMDRVERGERLTLRGTIESSDKDNVVPLGIRGVDSRKIQSLVVRFPEKTESLDPATIRFIAPETSAESGNESAVELAQ